MYEALCMQFYFKFWRVFESAAFPRRQREYFSRCRDRCEKSAIFLVFVNYAARAARVPHYTNPGYRYDSNCVRTKKVYRHYSWRANYLRRENLRECRSNGWIVNYSDGLIFTACSNYIADDWIFQGSYRAPIWRHFSDRKQKKNWKKKNREQIDCVI